MPPVHALRVSNPFFEGANTVYVIESDPLTLIDTGVATQIAYDRLVAQFEENGLRIADVGRIILTHKHIDHIGNAWRIQEQTGAEVLIHESELKSIENVDEQGERFVTLLNRRFEVWDVPSRQYADNKQMPPWEIKPTRGSALQDGQKIDVGDEVLEVVHTPGHTMGSICLLSERHLFSGDHVLEKYRRMLAAEIYDKTVYSAISFNRFSEYRIWRAAIWSCQATANRLKTSLNDASTSLNITRSDC